MARSAKARETGKGRGPEHAIVIGAGIAGLAAVRVLSERGMQVTLLERDAEAPAESPELAFAQWRRRGAPQVRHSHAFLGRLRCLLRDHYPDLLAELRAHGVRDLDMIAHPPPALAPLARLPGDENLVALGCRRTTFEWVLRRSVLRNPRVRLVGGAQVCGLLASPGKTPVVKGVRYCAGGEESELDAAIVVDASGRASRAMDWLAAIGARPPHEEEESSGIVYYTRFYRLRPPATELPQSRHPAMADYHWIKFAVFPADERVFSITFAVPLVFPRLKVLARPAAFAAMVRAFPGLAAFTRAKVAEPITARHPVEAMGGLINRLRRFVDARGPVAERFFVLGDAAYCTNPLYGRGCTQGFLHAHLLGEALDHNRRSMRAAALALDRASRAEIEPFYHASVRADRDAVRKAEGRAPDSISERFLQRLFEEGVVVGTRCDPVIFRAFARMFNMLETPERALMRPEVLARAAWIMARGRRYNRRYALPDPPDRERTIARCEAAARRAVGAA